MLSNTWCDFWGGPVQGQVLNFGDPCGSQLRIFYDSTELKSALDPAEVIIANKSGQYGPEYSHSYLSVRHFMLDVLTYFDFMWYVTSQKKNLMMYFEEGI